MLEAAEELQSSCTRNRGKSYCHIICGKVWRIDMLLNEETVPLKIALTLWHTLEMMHSLFYLGWSWTHSLVDPPASAFWVARITGIQHHTWKFYFLWLYFICYFKIFNTFLYVYNVLQSYCPLSSPHFCWPQSILFLFIGYRRLQLLCTHDCNSHACPADSFPSAPPLLCLSQSLCSLFCSNSWALERVT